MRQIKQTRKTGETIINVNLCIDGSGKRNIQTGIGFFNHMLELFTFHGHFDLDLQCEGDLDVCPHHSIEDIAIVLGQGLDKALGDRKNITRYACCYLPMDECLSRTVIDVSGRPYHVFNAHFETPTIGSCPTEMIPHFFYSLAINAKLTLHQDVLYGQNDHHKAESLFKGLGRALSESVQLCQSGIPSTKGLL